MGTLYSHLPTEGLSYSMKGRFGLDVLEDPLALTFCDSLNTPSPLPLHHLGDALWGTGCSTDGRN